MNPTSSKITHRLRGDPEVTPEGTRLPPRRPLSYQQFLAWCDEDSLAEWVDGEVVMMSPASWRHQQLVDFLVSVLGIYVRRRRLGKIISAPFQMKTGADLPGREPDLLYVAQENLSRLHSDCLEGPADLVIEVVSPSSRLKDRGEKLAEYEMGGVREYWILDLEISRADFNVLGPDGCYARHRADSAGIYRSVVIGGLWVREDWLWLDPPPDVLDVLRDLGEL